MPTTVRIECSDLADMVLERLLDYDADDLVAFWERNFDHDPTVEVAADGDGLIATYADGG